MSAIPVVAIVDVGKTNKKLLLFNQDYQVVWEQSEFFPETTDEDGFACDDLALLTTWVHNTLNSLLANEAFKVRAINFTSYGASFVYVNKEGCPVAPLYNYLKPYPQTLHTKFYNSYGGEEQFSRTTASPVLGSLNSGMQLYRLKHEQPNVFDKAAYALHLPQYLSSMATGRFCTDITSIGCHTNLWNFTTHSYHQWVNKEGFAAILPPIMASDIVYPLQQHPNIPVGIGLHDSSAALIPYLVQFAEPFLLLSTGTWCISLNPFNTSPLTPGELQHDCLAYLQYNGMPVKASRLFAGHEHEEQVKRIAAYFNMEPDFYKRLSFSPEVYNRVLAHNLPTDYPHVQWLITGSLFATRDLSQFNNVEEAYHQLMRDLVVRQQVSTQLVLNNAPVKNLYVDGGFSKNAIYMQLLALAFPQIQVYAASVAQATALGAALVIHHAWNEKPVATNLVEKQLVNDTVTN